MMIQRTLGCTLWPFKIEAAIAKSSKRPLVQEPITTWSIVIGSLMDSTVWVFSGRWGNATTGFNSQEYSDSFKLYNKTVVKPLQDKICDIISEIYGIDEAIEIKPFNITFE